MGSCIQTEADVQTLSNVAVSGTCFSCIGRRECSLGLLPAISLHLWMIIMFMNAL